MQIGARIYYDMSTGNHIFTTPEFDNAYVTITIDNDFTNYRELSDRVRETVGVIQLPYNSPDFEKMTRYYFHIDVATNTIIWDEVRPEFEDSPKSEIQLLQEQVNDLNIAMAAIIGGAL